MLLAKGRETGKLEPTSIPGDAVERNLREGEQMGSSEEDERREKLRTLEQMRGQRETPTTVARPSSEASGPRGAKLRELLQQRRQGPNARGAGGAQGGGGMLLRALAQRGVGGAAGKQGDGGGGGGLLRMALANRANNPGNAGGLTDRARSGGPEGKAAQPGNRAQLLRRFMKARQDREGGKPGESAQQISDLESRVKQLTEEVERLRAERADQPAAAERPGSAATKAAPGKRKKSDSPS
jgi:hypothetical protein